MFGGPGSPYCPTCLIPLCPWIALGRELLAALGAAARQHFLAALGGHARAETVAALTDEPARLIGPLGAHDTPLSILAGKMKGRGLPHPPSTVKAQRGLKLHQTMYAMATTQRPAKMSHRRLWFGRVFGGSKARRSGRKAGAQAVSQAPAYQDR
jgi:hypothetical protein